MRGTFLNRRLDNPAIALSFEEIAKAIVAHPDRGTELVAGLLFLMMQIAVGADVEYVEAIADEAMGEFAYLCRKSPTAQFELAKLKNVKTSSFKTGVRDESNTTGASSIVDGDVSGVLKGKDESDH